MGSKNCALIVGAGGDFVDAIREMHNLLKVDATERGEATPLFRDPSTNKPLSYAYMLKMVRRVVAAIGEDPLEFGTHSMRIGGATALFAQGADPTVIKTMGRWSSDCYKLYVRACHERCNEWTRRMGSAVVTDVVVEYDEVDYY